MAKTNYELSWTSEPKYYVFFDIDGVLTSQRQEMAVNHLTPLWSKFDPVAIDFFNRIHDTYKDVQFVCISTWRNHLSLNTTMELWLMSCFTNAGFRGYINWDEWKVNMENDADLWAKLRAVEIREFLKERQYEDFIIFDDSDYGFNNVLDRRRFVQTDPENGFLVKHMKNALAIMGNWEKKNGK